MVLGPLGGARCVLFIREWFEGVSGRSSSDFQPKNGKETRQRGWVDFVGGMVVSDMNNLSSTFRASNFERTFVPFPLLPSLDL